MDVNSLWWPISRGGGGGGQVRRRERFEPGGAGGTTAIGGGGCGARRPITARLGEAATAQRHGGGGGGEEGGDGETNLRSQGTGATGCGGRGGVCGGVLGTVESGVGSVGIQPHRGFCGRNHRNEHHHGMIKESNIPEQRTELPDSGALTV